MLGPSVQALLDANDMPEHANEPGPGHYFGPESAGFAACGPQKFAKNASAPEIGFARTGWDSWRGVCISKEHGKAFLGRESPGAAYDVPEMLSKHGTKVGTSLRPDLAVSLGVDPHGSPGPAYNLRESPSQQMHVGSERPGAVKKGFGLASRFLKDGREGGIGPGEYKRKDVALNLESGRSIGTGRKAWEKVVTIGWETEGRCRASPGPGPPLWRDIKKEGSKGAPIGRAERFPLARSASGPGPGEYSQGERQVARTKQYVSDTRNPQQAPFGKKPTKPRFRMQLALNTGKHGGWGYF